MIELANYENDLALLNHSRWFVLVERYQKQFHSCEFNWFSVVLLSSDRRVEDMLKYLFANSSKINEAKVRPGSLVFTYHQKSAIKALLAGFLMAALVEATVLHILLAMWNHWVALVATLSTALVAIQIMGQIRAVGMRPIQIQDGKLFLRNGAFDLAEISMEQIDEVELTTKTPEDVGEFRPLNVGFPLSHNVILKLKQPADATILNRTRRSFQVALIAVDEPQVFRDSIAEISSRKNKSDQVAD